jgi:hypothetical protein
VFWTGGVMTANLYARNDIIESRAISTGVHVSA